MTSFQVSFIGNATVGKTTIIDCITKAHTQPSPTVGGENSSCQIRVGTSSVCLNLWDTAGTEMYRSIMPIYLRDAKGIVMCFALDDLESFDAISSVWLEEVDNFAPNATKFLVGNKLDLESARKITREQGEALAKNIQAAFYREMVANGNDVRTVGQLFVDVATNLKEGQELKPRVVLPPVPNQGEQDCC
jgi:small GTP-binding protein